MYNDDEKDDNETNSCNNKFDNSCNVVGSLNKENAEIHLTKDEDRYDATENIIEKESSTKDSTLLGDNLETVAGRGGIKMLPLVNSPLYSDLTVRCNDGLQIYLHKIVLHCVCPKLIQVILEF